MRLKWLLVSVYLEIVLILTQDSCTVCAERTTGLKIISDTPDGTPGEEAQVDAHFGLFGDSANFDAR
jgi:hypothetical protein